MWLPTAPVLPNNAAVVMFGGDWVSITEMGNGHGSKEWSCESGYLICVVSI